MAEQEMEEVNKDRAESAPADQPNKPVDDNLLKINNDPEETGQTLPAAVPPGLEPSGLYRGPLADEAREGRSGEGASSDASSPVSPRDEIRNEAEAEGDTRPETELINEKVVESDSPDGQGGTDSTNAEPA